VAIWLEAAGTTQPTVNFSFFTQLPVVTSTGGNGPELTVGVRQLHLALDVSPGAMLLAPTVNRLVAVPSRIDPRV
jgi:hypothetical protein